MSTKNSVRSTSDMARLKALIVLKSIVVGRLFHTLIKRHTMVSSGVGTDRFI